jgi:hypothetical protein
MGAVVYAVRGKKLGWRRSLEGIRMSFLSGLYSVVS